MFIETEKVCRDLPYNSPLPWPIVKCANAFRSDRFTAIESHDEISYRPRFCSVGLMRRNGSVYLDRPNVDAHERHRSIEQRAAHDKETYFPAERELLPDDQKAQNLFVGAHALDGASFVLAGTGQSRRMRRASATRGTFKHFRQETTERAGGNRRGEGERHEPFRSLTFSPTGHQ